ncbi:MAG: hypothetical protein ACKO2P_20955, partial [Planctomycetota bacterium]
MFRLLPITALLISTLLAGGCNTSRTLTRREYEETRDPFMDGGSGVAGSATGGGAGVASLDSQATADSSSSAAFDPRPTPPLPGPKPIQRASAVQSPRSAGTGIAHAAYPQPETVDEASASAPLNAIGTTGPAASAGTSVSSGRSWQGPALSNFLSGRDDAPQASISGESVRTRTSAGLSGNPSAAVPSTSPARRSPAAEAAAMSEMDREIGGVG